MKRVRTQTLRAIWKDKTFRKAESLAAFFALGIAIAGCDGIRKSETTNHNSTTESVKKIAQKLGR